MHDEFLNTFCNPRKLMTWIVGWLVMMGGMGLSACAGAPPVDNNWKDSALVTEAWTATTSPTRASTSTPLHSTTPTATLAPTPKPTLNLCSPLKGYSLDDLNAAISNPFHPPPPGSDDPHQGVDFAQIQSGMAVVGWPVQAALDGIVAGVILDRFPYGNAVLIETPLKDLPQDWLSRLKLPEEKTIPLVKSALTCPEVEGLPYPEGSERSLYLLYAHLQDMQMLEVDQPVNCGDSLGVIGQSGNALNPHLHLEVRVGPSGTRFAGLAHYLTNASPEEMRNYCLWRVSGTFSLVDPIQLLEELD